MPVSAILVFPCSSSLLLTLHPVYFKKTSAAPFGNRSPQLRGAWVCSWADVQNLQGGAAPPHQTETRWTETNKFLCISAPPVQAPHFSRLLCWMGVARYSRNYSGCLLIYILATLLLVSLPCCRLFMPTIDFAFGRVASVRPCAPDMFLACFVWLMCRPWERLYALRLTRIALGLPFALLVMVTRGWTHSLWLQVLTATHGLLFALDLSHNFWTIILI